MPEGDATIQLAHGGGGRLSQQLLQELLLPALGPSNRVPHDAALLASPGEQLAFTTDSYVVRPLFFPGGDIGRLSVIGSVNDLAMAGARPVAMSLALILEEGLPVATLKQVLASIQRTAQECDVAILTGDTKVVERGKGDGIYITTSAVGAVSCGLEIQPGAIEPGDAVLVSGELGRHGLAILAAREELGLRTALESDLAPLHQIVRQLLDAGVGLHCLRDLTRGGLASAIHEIARDAGCSISLEEAQIPVDPTVHHACELLGLDPLAMANEGRMLLICPQTDVELALTLLQQHNPEACRIGVVEARSGDVPPRRLVRLHNELGVTRPMELGRGDQLPRIC